MQQEGLLCGAVQPPAGRGAVGLHQPYPHLHHYSCLGSCLLPVVYRTVTMQETLLLCVQFQQSPKQTYQMQALQVDRAGFVFLASCWHVALAHMTGDAYTYQTSVMYPSAELPKWLQQVGVGGACLTSSGTA